MSAAIKSPSLHVVGTATADGAGLGAAPADSM